MNNTMSYEEKNIPASVGEDGFVCKEIKYVMTASKELWAGFVDEYYLGHEMQSLGENSLAWLKSLAEKIEREAKLQGMPIEWPYKDDEVVSIEFDAIEFLYIWNDYQLHWKE